MAQAHAAVDSPDAGKREQVQAVLKPFATGSSSVRERPASVAL